MLSGALNQTSVIAAIVELKTVEGNALLRRLCEQKALPLAVIVVKVAGESVWSALIFSDLPLASKRLHCDWLINNKLVALVQADRTKPLV